MGACTYSAGWGCFAAKVVVSKAEAFGALGASIEAKVFGDLETASKEEEAFQGGGGVGISYNGEDH